MHAADRAPFRRLQLDRAPADVHMVADHALLQGLYELDGARDAATGAARPIELEAVFVNGRAVIVYSPNDTLAMLKGVHDPYANAYDADSSRKLALNILSYAVRR